MIYMVTNAKLPTDQVSDTRAGPQIRGEPCGFRSRQERSLEFLSLDGRELGRSPRHGPCRQGQVPTLPVSGLPPAHTSPVHTHPPGHFPGVIPALQQLYGPIPTALQLFGASFAAHHAPPVAPKIGHTLCRNQ